MSWIQEVNLPYETFESLAINDKELAKDLEQVFARLNEENTIKDSQLLFFIDATNGHIFISGYNHSTSETNDDNGIWVSLQKLWDDKDNAMDFDEIVMSATSRAIKSESGNQLKKRYHLFYQTEVDDAEEL